MWQSRYIATARRHTSCYPPVVYEALKFEVRQPMFLIDSVFTADTLHYAATLIFDPLTLNVCSVSAVTRSDSVPNFSEIEQSAAELLMAQPIFPALFSGGILSGLVLRTGCTELYQIWRRRRTLNISFDFPTCCTILKPRRFKYDCGRKSRPTFGLFDPCKN